MENASKALLIAAGVLIVILLITMGIRVFNSSSNSAEDAQKVGKGMQELSHAAINKITNNLFDISKVLSNAQIINNNNKSISIYNHACTAARPNTLKDYCPNLEVGKTYIISAKHDIITEYYQRIYLSGSNVTWRFDTNDYRTRTITQEDLDSQVIWYKDEDKEYNTVWDIQIKEVVDGK